jgi:hypothetical protein
MDDWEMSGPEEGDHVDRRVFVSNVNAPGYDVIEIRAGSTARKKYLARLICKWLNTGEAILHSPLTKEK